MSTLHLLISNPLAGLSPSLANTKNHWLRRIRSHMRSMTNLAIVVTVVTVLATGSSQASTTSAALPRIRKVTHCVTQILKAVCVSIPSAEEERHTCTEAEYELVVTGFTSLLTALVPLLNHQSLWDAHEHMLIIYYNNSYTPNINLCTFSGEIT